ncbi:DNA repair protein RAD51-like protein 2 [Heterocephalus glaber]|uniref:DNA repair protein RAD51-like protein 2 n=1 Tax=Heterocephalus glaber TaxID=10181 RepID=G5C7X1_HETGA|nr:DNA repair protein RAD51-like protein 2 [Heterocephalus glaber]
MMSVLATLPTNMGGLEGAVVYIDTESAFSAERLIEIAESRFPRYFNIKEKLLLTSTKVHVFRELTCEEVLQRIESLEEEIISKKVKVVIIDSIASVVRKEFDTQLQGNMRERNKFLAKGASLLKYLAEEFSIPGDRQRWPPGSTKQAHPLAANRSREDRRLITGTVTRYLQGEEEESDERLGKASARDSKWATLREGMEDGEKKMS